MRLIYNVFAQNNTKGYTSGGGGGEHSRERLLRASSLNTAPEKERDRKRVSVIFDEIKTEKGLIIAAAAAAAASRLLLLLSQAPHQE
jgi:hypothetical protein